MIKNLSSPLFRADLHGVGNPDRIATDAKRASDALSTGREKALKGALGTDWMRDLYVKEKA
tara:strand:- start:2 stop:184 length:183 start_codon:yes stop_codon:yes gene_type:complete